MLCRSPSTNSSSLANTPRDIVRGIPDSNTATCIATTNYPGPDKMEGLIIYSPAFVTAAAHWLRLPKHRSLESNFFNAHQQYLAPKNRI
jgi:hypothetical protein